MATLTGGPITAVAESDAEYTALLADAQANPNVEVVSTDAETRTIVFNLI